MYGKTKFNFWFDLTIFTTFLITALTGVLLWLVLPSGQGSGWVVFIGLTRRDWVNLHDWAGLAMISGVILHLVLHWRWISCVAGRFFKKLPGQARLNFSLNSLMVVVFFLSSLSGLVAWLVLPGGGYRGGRNALYNAAMFSLTRHDWNDLHLWTSLALLTILLIHFILHWPWIMCVLRRYAQAVPCPSDECATA
jgi:hypothetical protein